MLPEQSNARVVERNVKRKRCQQKDMSREKCQEKEMSREEKQQALSQKIAALNVTVPVHTF